MMQFVGVYVNPGLNVSLSELDNWLTLMPAIPSKVVEQAGLQVTSLYSFYDDPLDKVLLNGVYI